MVNKILGAWYGQALGDAMGMPGELWHIDILKSKLGYIDKLLPGHPDNIASFEFKAGEFTDDTSCAIAIANKIIQNNGDISAEEIGSALLEWALSIDAFNRNILGPSSKSSLTAIQQGEPIKNLENLGTTNGSVMRILPIACAYNVQNLELFFEKVITSCIPTHKSDIAIAGTCVIAWVISSAINGKDWKEIKNALPAITDKAQQFGTKTYAPSLKRRIDYALKFAKKLKEKTNIDSHREFFDEIGVGMSVIETVPAALAIIEYTNTDPQKTAIFCANIGGDTDTIGAIATAICGAIHGSTSFKSEEIQLIESVNNIDFKYISQKLIDLRK